MLWQILNTVTGHHYLISCLFLLVLGVIVIMYQPEFSDRTNAISAAMAGFVHPMFLLLSEVNTISAFRDMKEELSLLVFILEIIFMVFSILTMPCLRLKKLKTPRGYGLNILLVLGYYSFGMIIGVGIRQISLSNLFNARVDSFPLHQAIIVLIGALIIYLATFKLSARERHEDANETLRDIMKNK